MSDTKALTGVEIKDAEKGTVEAVFATLDVVDSDGDITVPGAFQDGAKVRISAFGHASWGMARRASSVPMPPVGKGVLRMTDTEAVLEGQFFLKTLGGRDTFELVKEMDELQEWSYGYDVLEKKDPDDGQKALGATRILSRLAVHEVSPVLIGSGVNTRTVGVKHDSGDDYLTFPDQFEGVLGDVKGLVDRVEGWGQDPEHKAGRVLSAANRERLASLSSSLGETLTRLEELLAESDPDKDRGEIERQLMRYEQLRSAL